jgi:methionyl-tRNA formyltransferase
MKVVFMGNHTVGVRTLEALHAAAQVVGVVAHPLDPEDGVRYESVFCFAVERGWNVTRGKANDPGIKTFVSNAKADLIWITDYRYLLPTAVLTLAPLGAVNLHPSLLPKYRGRASINWAILKGETRLGLTAHFVDHGMDTGDIIEQTSFELRDNQDVGDCLEILYPLYTKITRQVLEYFYADKVPRRPQDHSQASEFSRRRPEDGAINWNEPAHKIRDLIRAVAYPYPGAFTTLNGTKLVVWKAVVAPTMSPSSEAGCVLRTGQDGITVQCGQGSLLLTRVEGLFSDGMLKPRLKLGS